MAKTRSKKAPAKKAPAKKGAAKKASTSPRRAAPRKPTPKPAARPAPKPAPKAKAAAPTKPAAAKGRASAPPRTVPKVSPLRGTSVEDWAKERLNDEQAEVLAVLRTVLAEEGPKVRLVIKWAQPVWEADGPIAYFKPSSTHMTFGFWHGGLLEDPARILEGEGDRMKHVKLRSLADAQRAEVRDFVKQAVRLNREKGDPTKL